MNDLAALIARIKDLPAGSVLTVLIPKGQAQTLGGLVVQENETYAIPASLFAAPAPQADPVLTDERTMVATVNLNIRGVPERSAVILGMVQSGEQVRVKGSPTNGYLKLVGRDGYVLAEGLAPIT